MCFSFSHIFFCLPASAYKCESISSVKKKTHSLSLIIGVSSCLSFFSTSQSISYQTARRNILLPPRRERSQSENSRSPAAASLAALSSVWESTGGRRIPREAGGNAVWVNTDETAAPLSLREAAERPLLSHTLASFHPAISYLSF